MKSLVLWLVVFGAVFLGAGRGYAQGSGPGRIILAKIVGEVRVTAKADGVSRPAANNEEIAAGYVVTTAADSTVILVFSNGSTLNLREDSVLDIETFLQDPFAADVQIATMSEEPSTSTTRLNLTRGEVIGSVRRLNIGQGSSFTMQTPAGAAGVRGTVFRILFRPLPGGRASFVLTTTEGTVVLNQGTTEVPVAFVNGAAQEIAVEVDVVVNAATGQLSVTLPAQTFAVQAAPPASVETVAAMAQQIADTVATVVIAPTPPSSTGPNEPQAGNPPPADSPAPPEDGAAPEAPRAPVAPPVTPPVTTPQFVDPGIVVVSPSG